MKSFPFCLTLQCQLRVRKGSEGGWALLDACIEVWYVSMQENEIKNGRLAMIAFLGFVAQHAATGKVGPYSLWAPVELLGTRARAVNAALLSLPCLNQGAAEAEQC